MAGMKLSGEFDHALDPKGRVTLPARYRDYFRDGAILVRLPRREPCLCVYRQDAWDAFDEKYLEGKDYYENEHDRWSVRDIYRMQDFVEPDAQGRILLPDKRREELRLNSKVKIIGARDCLEIWDPDTWDAALADETKRRGGDNG